MTEAEGRRQKTDGRIVVVRSANERAFAERTPTMRHRRGLSYLEVLIAAGIALTGILGAVALFPVAILNLQKGLIVDVAAAVGPSSLETAPALGVTTTSNW